MFVKIVLIGIFSEVRVPAFVGPFSKDEAEAWEQKYRWEMEVEYPLFPTESAVVEEADREKICLPSSVSPGFAYQAAKQESIYWQRDGKSCYE